MGNSLTVANKATSETFKVTVNQNLTITNHEPHSGNLKPGEITTTVKENDISNYYGQEGDKVQRKQSALNLASTRYGLFDALRKLDGNPNDLSDIDIQRAKSLQGKVDGLKNIKQDIKNGVTIFQFNDGNFLKFESNK